VINSRKTRQGGHVAGTGVQGRHEQFLYETMKEIDRLGDLGTDMIILK
jgi:hypothetical protein